MTHMTMEKKAMTKKGHQIFGEEKCTPSEKILATPSCISVSLWCVVPTVELFGALASVFRQTLARVLVIILSLGYGIVK